MGWRSRRSCRPRLRSKPDRFDIAAAAAMAIAGQNRQPLAINDLRDKGIQRHRFMDCIIIWAITLSAIYPRASFSVVWRFSAFIATAMIARYTVRRPDGAFRRLSMTLLVNTGLMTELRLFAFSAVYYRTP